MQVLQIQVGEMANFCYVLYEGKSKKAFIIDPSWEAEKTLKEINKLNLNLEAIFLTHAHYDHINACEDFLKLNIKNIYMHKADLFLLKNEFKNVIYIKDEEEINFYSSKIKIIHTPGHTPGSVCYLIDNKLFTGDTLFVGTCGRVDLPLSNPEDMKKSLKKISLLPKETEIYPGHFYNDNKSILEKELKSNPCFDF